jgi:hypothetical protein
MPKVADQLSPTACGPLLPVGKPLIPFVASAACGNGTPDACSDVLMH